MSMQQLLGSQIWCSFLLALLPVLTDGQPVPVHSPEFSPGGFHDLKQQELAAEAKNVKEAQRKAHMHLYGEELREDNTMDGHDFYDHPLPGVLDQQERFRRTGSKWIHPSAGNLIQSHDFTPVVSTIEKRHREFYPKSHFDTVRRYKSPHGLERHVQDTIADGKTLFVRWIPSPTSSKARSCAAAWNNMTKAFEDNPLVEFGEVNMEAFQVRKIFKMDMDPGHGGWPTLRYFNDISGVGGAVYHRKTRRDLYIELGTLKYLKDFIEEAGNVTLCPAWPHAPSKEDCSEEDLKYLGRWQDKNLEELEKENNRLQTLWWGKTHQIDQRRWLGRRARFISQLIDFKKKERKELKASEL
mmetsp:Transcript_143255/g.249855  ORF Transcript_143255/g.249855 Transcript_143255/m.249855 type:complete len:355 (-) Transcript_143255:27-1091(-)